MHPICAWARGHPLRSRNLLVGTTLQKEWLFLTQQLSPAISFPGRDAAWKAPPKCMLKSWLVWACAGPVPITTSAMSWWVHQACCLQKRARHSPPSPPPTLTFVLSLPPWHFREMYFFFVVILEKVYFVIEKFVLKIILSSRNRYFNIFLLEYLELILRINYLKMHLIFNATVSLNVCYPNHLSNKRVLIIQEAHIAFLTPPSISAFLDVSIGWGLRLTKQSLRLLLHWLQDAIRKTCGFRVI